MNCPQCNNAKGNYIWNSLNRCAVCFVTWPQDSQSDCRQLEFRQALVDGTYPSVELGPNFREVVRKAFNLPAEQAEKPQDTPSLGDIINGRGERISVSGDAKIRNDGVIETGPGAWSITVTPWVEQYGNLIDGEWRRLPHAEMNQEYVPNPDLEKLRAQVRAELDAMEVQIKEERERFPRRLNRIPLRVEPNPTVNWRGEPTAYPPKPYGGEGEDE